MSKQVFTTGQVLTSLEMSQLQTNDYNQTVSAKVASYVLVAADAGTRITMSNASATTVTVNTALFAAGDTLIITNIGVGVSTITAGTATVSTAGSLALNQYDSGTLYFTSTGVAIWNGANPGDITGITTGGTSGLTGGVTSGTADLKLAVTTNGDLLYGTGSGTVARLGIGSSAQVLSVSGGIPAWTTASAGGGKVLQVVNSNYSTSTSSTTATWAATGNTITITPTLNTSKVWITMSLNACQSNSPCFMGIRLKRGSTVLTTLDTYGGYSTAANNEWGGISTSWLDSPATTSATTYTIEFQNANPSAAVTVLCQNAGGTSTMSAFEIGA